MFHDHGMCVVAHKTRHEKSTLDFLCSFSLGVISDLEKHNKCGLSLTTCFSFLFCHSIFPWVSESRSRKEKQYNVKPSQGSSLSLSLLSSAFFLTWDLRGSQPGGHCPQQLLWPQGGSEKREKAVCYSAEFKPSRDRGILQRRRKSKPNNQSNFLVIH